MNNLLGIIIVVLLLAASIGPFLITLFSRRYPRESKGFNPSSPQNIQVTPATSPGKLMDLDRLRVELRDRYKRTRNLADLDAAISISQQIVQATPLDSPNRPERMNSLGAALLDRYGRTKNVANLNAAITAFQQAVQATSSDSPDQPLYLDNLSVGFRNRYLLTKVLADLQAAISASQQAVQATPVSSTDRPRRLNNLSLGLRDRSALSGIGKALDLEEAISASRQAVEATPLDAADRPTYLTNLGSVLYRRYKLAEDVADLEAAITVFQKAVDATSPDAADRPTYLKNLNLGLRDRSTFPGNQAGMEPSPTGSQPVTQTASSPSYHQFMYLNLLGRELFSRYEDVGDLADLHAAISAVQRAIQVMPTDLPEELDLLSYLDTLGSELFNRYTDTRSVADLEAAITAFQHVVQAAPPNAADRSEYLNHLGVVLRARYERTRNVADLKEAIRVSQQAVEAAPLDLPERPELLRNVGIARHDYYMHIGDQAYLKAAITDFRQAVEGTPAKSPDRSMRLTSLGAGLLDLYKCTKNRADLEEAITAFQQAVEAASSDSPEQPLLLANLGAGLRDRYECTKNLTDLEEAIRVSQQAVQAAPLDLPERSELLRNVGLMLVEHFHTTGDLASLEATISLWEQSWSIQHLHFAALPVTYQLGQQHQGEGIASDLVTAYLEQAEANGRFILDREKQHHLRFLSVPPRVLEIAEGSKSRLLTQLVGRGPLPLPPGLAPDIAVREQHLLAELIALDTEELATHDRPVFMQKETGSLQRLQQRQMLLHDLEQLWTQIARDSPEGAEYVALRRGDVPTWQEFTDLAKALGPETALLSFFLIQEEALLFLLRAGWRVPCVIGIPLNQTDRADLWELLRHEVHIPRTETWDQLLRPLFTNAQFYLNGVKRLILAPAGIGHLLPWTVLAERIGWYTPAGLPLPLVTLPALSVLPRLQQRLSVPKGQALVIGNPLGDRPHMENEARTVAERFGATPLLRGAATKQAVLANLERASLIHLATHAFFDSENPLDSGIVLAGEEILTAREILQHRLQADLLVLSACESGQVGSLGGEELAGLSQAFLQAGVRSLLVSLWQVNDESTAALMQAFYDAREEAGADKALALRQAMTQVQHDPKHPRWQHPYYWGAFILVGDWD
jgi:tetratricopeptide (TPR) repeat protein